MSDCLKSSLVTSPPNYSDPEEEIPHYILPGDCIQPLSKKVDGQTGLGIVVSKLEFGVRYIFPSNGRMYYVEKHDDYVDFGQVSKEAVKRVMGKDIPEPSTPQEEVKFVAIE